MRVCPTSFAAHQNDLQVGMTVAQRNKILAIAHDSTDAVCVNNFLFTRKQIPLSLIKLTVHSNVEDRPIPPRGILYGGAEIWSDGCVVIPAIGVGHPIWAELLPVLFAVQTEHSRILVSNVMNLHAPYLAISQVVHRQIT